MATLWVTKRKHTTTVRTWYEFIIEEWILCIIECYWVHKSYISAYLEQIVVLEYSIISSTPCVYWKNDRKWNQDANEMNFKVTLRPISLHPFKNLNFADFWIDSIASSHYLFLTWDNCSDGCYIFVSSIRHNNNSTLSDW